MPRASVNGTELWYQIQGEGDPILLLPGLGLDHNYYRFAEPLLRSKRRTIRVDPRGVGASRKDSPAAVHYTPDLWADDFGALIEHLGAARCTFWARRSAAAPRRRWRCATRGSAAR